jgi:hypothetical protein
MMSTYCWSSKRAPEPGRWTAGVQDRDVDPAEGLLDRGHRAFDRRPIGDVERKGPDVSAFRAPAGSDRFPAHHRGAR